MNLELLNDQQREPLDYILANKSLTDNDRNKTKELFINYLSIHGVNSGWNWFSDGTQQVRPSKLTD